MCWVEEGVVVREDVAVDQEQRPPAGPLWAVVIGLILLAGLLVWTETPGGFLIWAVVALAANVWSVRRGDRVPLIVHTVAVGAALGGLVGLAGLGVMVWMLVA